MSYKLYIDATADLSVKKAAEAGLNVIPMEYALEGEVQQYLPGESGMTVPEFYNELRSGACATTSQINAFTFKALFEPILENGQDVLYMGFSSGLSGTVQAAGLAADELNAKYPGRRVAVVDTLSASLGEGLLVYTAGKKRLAGMGLEELRLWVEGNKRGFVHWFTVDDLNHLKRGGRVSAAAAAFGTALRIKPVLHVDGEGRLIPMEKVQGRKKALKKLVDKMEETFIPDKNDVIFIGHGDCLEDAERVKDDVRERFGVKEIYIDFIGPIIGAHSGPGTVALFYYGAKR